jgi:guanylate kinase
MNQKGLLIIISSPSGGGKTTVKNRLLELMPEMYYSISCTTRKPRTGETEGKDYNFISEEEFLKKKEKGAFLEFAKVYNSYYYGTLEAPIDENLEKGKDVLLDIDTQGAMQVSEKKECVLIFILPPSLEILKSRLFNRKTDSENEIWKRLKEAEKELKLVHNYDYAVLNDNIDQTVEKIKAIITAEKYCVERQKPFLNMLQESLK